MAIAAVRTAVRELAEGTIGSSATVPVGLFAYGVYDEQPTQAQQALAAQVQDARHRFDVVVGRVARHPSSPVSALSKRRIVTLPVTVNIYTKLATTAQEAQRSADLERIPDDADTLIRALNRPHNLDATDGGVLTRVVSGMMLGPGGDGAPEWELIDEGRDKGVARSRITGACIVDVLQAETPDDIYTYANIVAWYDAGNGTFTDGTATQLDDQSGNGNDVTQTTYPPAWTRNGDLNYTPEVTFDGTDDLLKKASGFTLGTSDYTLWILVKVNSWIEKGRIVVALAVIPPAFPLGQLFLTIKTGPDHWEFNAVDDAGTSVIVTTTTGANDGGYHLLRLHVDSATADTIGIGVDGASPATTAWTGTNGDIINLRFAVGNNETVFHGAFTMKECLIVGVVSTAAQDAKMLDYIRDKYGLNI